MDLHFEKRPRVQLELSTSDKVAEILTWATLLIIWSVVLLNYTTMPDTIPIHRNASGDIDGYGNKSNIFVEPVIATIFVIGLTFLNKFPHWFNYARKITAENAYKQYLAATRLIRYLKFAASIIFLITIITTIKAANSDSISSGAWLLPCILGIIFTPILFFGLKLIRK